MYSGPVIYPAGTKVVDLWNGIRISSSGVFPLGAWMTSTEECTDAGKLSSERLNAMHHFPFFTQNLNNHMRPPKINSMPNSYVGLARKRFWNILMRKQAENWFFVGVSPAKEHTCASSGRQPKRRLKDSSLELMTCPKFSWVNKSWSLVAIQARRKSGG
ncbi:hypothetical protein BDR07DRAFT_1419042 [Suillus spraguei]|nr:hypothetical protein BDR07DRAFT_1419042 [Suillus spraguei]